METIFWLVEVNFSDTPASEMSLSCGNVFLNEFFILYGGDGFSVLWKPFFSYLLFFFFKWKPSLKLVETNIFGKDFVPVERLCSGRKGFSTMCKLFSFISCVFPACGNRY